MELVDWSSVLYNESEERLAIIGQSLTHLPAAVMNLYSNRVKHLDLSSNIITDLNWLELFSNLETLILDGNDLWDEAFIKLKTRKDRCFENIKIISLNNNKLENLSLILKHLAKYLPNLEYLSLLKNPLCPDGLSKKSTSSLTYELYRKEVSKYLGKLKFLDYMKVSRQFTASVPEHRATVLKFSLRVVYAKLVKGSDEQYSPLPNNVRPVGDHCGSYGVCLYKYKGNHSEGNRFILNNDL